MDTTGYVLLLLRALIFYPKKGISVLYTPCSVAQGFFIDLMMHRDCHGDFKYSLCKSLCRFDDAQGLPQGF